MTTQDQPRVQDGKRTRGTSSKQIASVATKKGSTIVSVTTTTCRRQRFHNTSRSIVARTDLEDLNLEGLASTVQSSHSSQRGRYPFKSQFSRPRFERIEPKAL